MDHREQMQQEAEQWQEKSVKIIQAVRYGVLIFGILGVLVLFVQNMGFPKEINETYPAAIITEDGQLIEYSVDIRGEITNYPLKADEFGMDDQVTIYANGKQLVMHSYNKAETADYLFGQRGVTVCIMAVQRDVVLLETDIQNVFPEMESQRCLLLTGQGNAESVWEKAASYDLPAEFLDQFTLFQDQ